MRRCHSNITKIKQNQERLTRLKVIIHEGLYWRCQAHSLLDVPRNVDDIVSALCSKVNKLEILKSPLDIKTPYSETLNDDRRVAIYDYLEGSSLDKDNLHKIVLSPIPKQGHAAFKTAAEIKKDLKEIKKFNKSTLQELTPDSIDGSFLSSRLKKITPSFVTKTAKKTFQAMKDIFSDLGILTFLLKLWSLRYIAYLALTFIGYHYLILALHPVVSTLLGSAAFGLLDSVLFYTLALAPVWVFGGMLLLSLKQSVVNYFTHWKKEDIYQSLDSLVTTQEFFANHLSQVIIDIPHFDIQHLTEQVQLHSEKLTHNRAKLNRFYFGERFFCRGIISQNVELVKAKTEAQQKQLKSQLKQVSNHIALRVGDDIELLEKSASKQKLTPIIPHQQLEKLKHFVATFGDEMALHQFEQNANPIHKWMNKIERCSRAQKSQAASLAQPWGGHVIREDYLRGWEIILKGYIPNGAKQESALQISKLLAGKIQPTMQQLQEWVNQLGLGDKSALLLQKIQDHVFHTINPENPQNARLVSKHHQDLISSWYQQHKEEIKQAEKQIKQLFSAQRDDRLVQQLDSLGDEALSNIYELLDGVDIYSYLSKQSNGDQRKNLARQYFENYKGETSQSNEQAPILGLHALLEQLINHVQTPIGKLEKLDPLKDIVLVNLKNGTFEIAPENTRLRPFNRNDFITYQLPFDYDPSAKAPMFEDYLNRVLPDKDSQNILSEYLGSIFIRNSTLKLEKALLLHGSGANGKSE